MAPHSSSHCHFQCKAGCTISCNTVIHIINDCMRWHGMVYQNPLISDLDMCQLQNVVTIRQCSSMVRLDTTTQQFTISVPAQISAQMTRQNVIKKCLSCPLPTLFTMTCGMLIFIQLMLNSHCTYLLLPQVSDKDAEHILSQYCHL
jgi:hypothetical protein